MIRILIAFFCLHGLLCAEPLFNAPEGFLSEPLPDIDVEQISEIEFYSYKGGLMRIVILTGPPVMSQNGLKSFMRGLTESMRNQDFQNISISETNIKGYYSKKAIGQITPPNNQGSFRSESLSIFTSDRVFTLTLLKHESTNSDLVVEDLVDSLSVTGAVVNFPPQQTTESRAVFYSVGYLIGLIGPVLLVVYIVIAISRRKKLQNKSE